MNTRGSKARITSIVQPIALLLCIAVQMCCGGGGSSGGGVTPPPPPNPTITPATQSVSVNANTTTPLPVTIDHATSCVYALTPSDGTPGEASLDTTQNNCGALPNIVAGYSFPTGGTSKYVIAITATGATNTTPATATVNLTVDVLVPTIANLDPPNETTNGSGVQLMNATPNSNTYMSSNGDFSYLGTEGALTYGMFGMGFNNPNQMQFGWANNNAPCGTYTIGAFNPAPSDNPAGGGSSPLITYQVTGCDDAIQSTQLGIAELFRNGTSNMGSKTFQVGGAESRLLLFAKDGSKIGEVPTGQMSFVFIQFGGSIYVANREGGITTISAESGKFLADFQKTEPLSFLASTASAVYTLDTSGNLRDITNNVMIGNFPDASAIAGGPGNSLVLVSKAGEVSVVDPALGKSQTITTTWQTQVIQPDRLAFLDASHVAIGHFGSPAVEVFNLSTGDENPLRLSDGLNDFTSVAGSGEAFTSDQSGGIYKLVADQAAAVITHVDPSQVLNGFGIDVDGNSAYISVSPKTAEEAIQRWLVP